MSPIHCARLLRLDLGLGDKPVCAGEIFDQKRFERFGAITHPPSCPSTRANQKRTPNPQRPAPSTVPSMPFTMEHWEDPIALQSVRLPSQFSLQRDPTMLNIQPTGATLGATVTGIDLTQPLSHTDFVKIIRALGHHGVLCFPKQLIDARALKKFSERFGSLQVVKGIPYFEPGMPEVSILSNIVEGGRNVGFPDAGQEWHTDMTYNSTVGFVNVLVAHKVPVREGVTLGRTEFTNTQAAYDDLDAALKTRLASATATHDLNFYWEYMRRERGSTRPALTPEQRAARPPVHHPVFLRHPITGRMIVYVNPGFTESIDGLERAESDAMLKCLFDHVLQPKYRHAHHWTEGDVLIWDHLGTWHYAVPDYRADEHRLMKRCQVMADRIFDPVFQREMLAA